MSVCMHACMHACTFTYVCMCVCAFIPRWVCRYVNIRMRVAHMENMFLLAMWNLLIIGLPLCLSI